MKPKLFIFLISAVLSSCLSIPSNPGTTAPPGGPLDVRLSADHLAWAPGRTGTAHMPLDFTFTAGPEKITLTQRQGTWVNAQNEELVPPTPLIETPQTLNPRTSWVFKDEIFLDPRALSQASIQGKVLGDWVFLKQTFFYQSPQGPGQITVYIPTLIRDEGSYDLTGTQEVHSKYFRFTVREEYFQNPEFKTNLTRFLPMADEILQKVADSLGLDMPKEPIQVLINRPGGLLPFGKLGTGATLLDWDSQGVLRSARLSLVQTVFDPPLLWNIFASPIPPSIAPHVLTHELTHYLIFTRLPFTPEWLGEGPAEWMAAKVTQEKGVSGVADTFMAPRHQEWNRKYDQAGQRFLFTQLVPAALEPDAYYYYQSVGKEFWKALDLAYGRNKIHEFFRALGKISTADPTWYLNLTPASWKLHQRDQSRKAVEVLFQTLGPESREFLLKWGVPGDWLL